MIYRKIVLSLITSASLLTNTFFLTSTAFAESSTDLSGNGALSHNISQTTNNSSTSVVQDNNAHITNNVDVQANTGNNSASENTGGSVSVLTGDASSRVSIANDVNLNKASMSDCGCTTAGSNTLISGNGAGSVNSSGENINKTVSAFQNNNAKINNDVDANVSTGKNTADENTADPKKGGQVTILTGNAYSQVALENAANANFAELGSGSSNAGKSTDIVIRGNGAWSNNSVGLQKDQRTSLVQGNRANITNYVDSKAKTGENQANENTGGNTLIGTGSAVSRISAATLANFNAASVDCGCVKDMNLKVSGNGAGSSNGVIQNSNDTASIFQGGKNAGNQADIANQLKSSPVTGKNENSENTRSNGSGTSSILTGDSSSTTALNTKSNVNLVGSDLNSLMPDKVNFDFNLGSVMGMFR